MARVFLTESATLKERWRHAFPQAVAIATLSELSAQGRSGIKSLWLDFGKVPSELRREQVIAARTLGLPVVAMVTVPQESEAFTLLNAGVNGYCHREAAAEQLSEIAMVVEHSGLWMPPQLLQRFLSLSTRVIPVETLDTSEFNDLTSREVMVAELVARGANNKEIAEALDITERTVKAHLSAIFEKLEVRDRVQLALKMNNISTHSTVN